MKSKKLLTALCLFTLAGCNFGSVSTSSSTNKSSQTSSSSINNNNKPSSDTPGTSSSSTKTPISGSSSTSSSSSIEEQLPEGAVSLGFVEEPNLPADMYGYWNDQWWVGSNVIVHKAYLHQNVAVFDYEYSPESATDWGFQVFYDNTQLEVGKTFIVTMNVNSEDACKVVLNGKTFNLVPGDNSLTATYVEPETGRGSISMQIDKSSDLRNTIKISNVNWEVTVSQLKAPEGIVIADEPSDGSKVIQFAPVSGATGYTVVYVDAETGEEVAREDVAQPGAKLTTKLEDGTYKVYVMAKGDGINSSDSALSSTFAYLLVGEIEEVDPNEKVDINFGEESNLPLNTFVYWNDQWWCGSNVVVHEAYLLNKVAVFDYEYSPESSTDWGFQVFYKNAGLTQGKTYTLTLNIYSEDAVNAKVNGQTKSLVAGDNAIEVEYIEGGAANASLSIQFDKSSDLRNTVKISDVIWASDDAGDSGNVGGSEDNGNKLSDVVGAVINPVPEGYIFACAPTEGAVGYHLQVLNSNGEVVAEQDITNGGLITCTSELEAGIYTIQVKAVSDGTLEDSNYVVVTSNFEVKDKSNEETPSEPEGPVVEGQAIAIDASKTKVEGAGIHIYLLDKPLITIDDINIAIVSFESTQFAGYKDAIMAGATKVHYVVEQGWVFATVANGFPNEGDQVMVVNISYTLDSVTYAQNLTFVGNAYQA